MPFCNWLIHVAESEAIDLPSHQCDWTPILTSTNTAQLISTTTDADGVVNQIYELSWNTLGLHNADYQLRLKADYNCNCHQIAFRSSEQTHTVNVKNLDITTCNPNGNVDYLRWDPNQNLADTTIQSTLEDNGTTDTTLSINIYHSDRTANPNPVKTVTVTTSSNSVYPYTWDGKDGSEATCPPGIYLFTVNATHDQTGGGDSVSDRAADAFIMEDRLVAVTGQIGYMDFEAKVQGTVTNSNLAIFDPQLVALGTTTGSTPLNPVPDWQQVARVYQDGDAAIWLMSGKDGTPGNDKSHKPRSVLGMNDEKLPICVLGVIGGEFPVGSQNYGNISYIQPSIESLYTTIANCLSPDGIAVRKAMRPTYGGTCGLSCSVGTMWLRQNSMECLHRGQVVHSLKKKQNGVFLFGGHANESSLYLNGGCTLADTSTLAGGNGKIAILLGCHVADDTAGESFGTKLSKVGWNVITSDTAMTAHYICVFADGLRLNISETPLPLVPNILPSNELQIGNWVGRANNYASFILLFDQPREDPHSFIWGVEWMKKYMVYLPAR